MGGLRLGKPGMDVALDVERRRADFADGQERYATDEEMAGLWKKCGL